jgi:hypothetical protein
MRAKVMNTNDISKQINENILKIFRGRVKIVVKIFGNTKTIAYLCTQIILTMGEVDNRVELDPWSWFVQVIQKGTFLQLKVLNHKDISEDEELLLRELYRVYWEGRYPIYQTQAVGTAETVKQNELFDKLAEDSAQSPDGTEVVPIEVNQNE